MATATPTGPHALAPFVGEHVAHETPVRLHLAMTGAEGCAVRALGVIVRRGWYLHAAELHPGQPGEARAMTVDVLARDASRAVATLKSQLERLYDMEAVTVMAAPSEEGA